MKKGKNSGERLLEEILKLDTIEFLGVCKILGIELVKKIDIGDLELVKTNEEDDVASAQVNVDVEPRQFEDIWCDMCDKLDTMNRTQRRNLGRLIYSATAKEEEK